MAEPWELSRKEIEILRILSESPEPIGSTFIRRELEKRGFFLSGRTVRYHLRTLELRGLVSGHERSGRTFPLIILDSGFMPQIFSPIVTITP